jgi:prevent-host-death family protein
MSVITANDLKTQGVSAIEKALEDGDETTISVRGKPRFVVMDIAHYDRLREAEIYAAWQEARAAVAAGEFVAEGAEEHIARLDKDSDADGL